MSAYAPLDIPESGKLPFTDYSRWRLRISDAGDHTWHYLCTDEECAAWPQADYDKYWLGAPLDLPELPKPTNALEAARNGYRYFKHLQAEDGHWAGECGGPMFLIPGLVIGSYVTGIPFKLEERLEIIRYLFNHANEDGGWGIQIEGPSTVFGTALNYCAMRILGVKPDHPVAVKARACLHKFGGALGAPSWGKFWMSVLNVYDWEGNHPVPAELWLLPDCVPIHPHRWWIHTRNIYIPMGYLYGVRFQMEETDLVLALREELYTQNYYSIDWPAQRSNVHEIDLYIPHSILLEGVYKVLGVYEGCAFPPLRRAAIRRSYELVILEDENTDCQDLGPVNKMMNQIVRMHAEGRDAPALRKHAERARDFMWMGAEGMMMCGMNGSQLWDIAFMGQALVETGLAMEDEFRESAMGMLRWLDMCQIRDNPKHWHTAYRQATKGAWPFSTRTQGYTVSDCTGEGLKAVMYIQEHVKGAPQLVSERRLCDAVDILLSLKNLDGGFASYEPIRAPQAMEYLNPAEAFGKIMTEYTYPECTTSVITALSIFRKKYPRYRADDIQRTITSAIDFLHKCQRPEGGWFGSWAICFSYATQFALESLSLVGETYANSKYARKACDFLVSKQRADGGWGESHKSCEIVQWVEHEQTQVVQTCWAAMALMYAQYPHAEPIERAVKLVISRQRPDGSWQQEAIVGSSNVNIVLSYPNFKFEFTVWMLGRAHQYLEELKARTA